MDERQAMALSGGSAPYYTNRGGIGGSGYGTEVSRMDGPPGFRPPPNSGNAASSHFLGSLIGGSAHFVESSPADFPHDIKGATFSGGAPQGESVKKKRGRPRKYGGPSFGSSPLPTASNPSTSPSIPSQKRSRGRPPGSGRKQLLASLGGWMNSSAGVAFAPHVINIGVGEDIAAKILCFSQQKSRAVCILSGSGAVSSVTLRQPASSGGTITYEGNFEIVCLSGSYLLAEVDVPHNRTGGISASLSSADGHVIGGAVSMLIASSPVVVMVCSFLYGNSKTKNKRVVGVKKDKDSECGSRDISAQNFDPATIGPGLMPLDPDNPHADIDLMRG